MITNGKITGQMRNFNIFAENLAKHNYKTFYDGKKIIAYKLDSNGFVANEMEICLDEKTNKYYCFGITDEGQEVFYHNENNVFCDTELEPTEIEYFYQHGYLYILKA